MILILRLILHSCYRIITNHSDNTIDINYTRSDDNLQSCWYSNDTYEVNTTLSNCGNITAVVWSQGLHNVTVWANDSDGNGEL